MDETMILDDLINELTHLKEVHGGNTKVLFESYFDTKKYSICNIVETHKDNTVIKLTELKAI